MTIAHIHDLRPSAYGYPVQDLKFKIGMESHREHGIPFESAIVLPSNGFELIHVTFTITDPLMPHLTEVEIIKKATPSDPKIYPFPEFRDSSLDTGEFIPLASDDHLKSGARTAAMSLFPCDLGVEVQGRNDLSSAQLDTSGYSSYWKGIYIYRTPDTPFIIDSYISTLFDSPGVIDGSSARGIPVKPLNALVISGTGLRGQIEAIQSSIYGASVSSISSSWNPRNQDLRFYTSPGHKDSISVIPLEDGLDLAIIPLSGPAHSIYQSIAPSGMISVTLSKAPEGVS
jgi:hypothetical protein